MKYLLISTILVVFVSICHIQTRNVPIDETAVVAQANETTIATTTTTTTTVASVVSTTVDTSVNETVKSDVISLNIEVANASKLEFDQPMKIGARYMCPPGYTGNSCEDRDPCFFNGPCGPYGRCVPAYDGTAKCECQSGYTGPTCQTSDPCSAYPCQHGQCVVQGNTFICQCSNGYTGQFCETVEPVAAVAYPNANSGSYNSYGNSYGSDYSSPCYANPCHNGGQCNPYGSTYACQCPTGYSGQNCDSYASAGGSYGGASEYGSGGGGYEAAPSYPNNDYSGPCYGNPCQNGGQCVPYGSTFICQCRPGYSGQKCDSGYGGGSAPSYSGSYSGGGSSYGGTGSSYGSGGYGGCSPNPCQNGGQCSPYSGSGGNNYGNVVCQCPQGYTGQSCGSSVYANGNY